MVSAELLQECLRDSPKFRALLAKEEAQIEQLEHRLERVVKTCGSMIDAGKTFVSQQTLFANSLWDLSSCFQEDPDTMTRLNRLIHSLQEMNKFQSILLDQASRTVLKNLSEFVKINIEAVWESRRVFDKISSDLDVALSRHSQVSKSKPTEIEQTNSILQATTTCFSIFIFSEQMRLVVSRKDIVIASRQKFVDPDQVRFSTIADKPKSS